MSAWFPGKCFPVSLGLSPPSFLSPATSFPWPQLTRCLSVLASARWVSVAQARLAQLHTRGGVEMGRVGERVAFVWGAEDDPAGDEGDQ